MGQPEQEEQATQGLCQAVEEPLATMQSQSLKRGKHAKGLVAEKVGTALWSADTDARELPTL